MALFGDNNPSILFRPADGRTADGGYRGFEDFCVLNSIGTNLKYNGSYESRIFKRIDEFTGLDIKGASAMKRNAFILMAINCAIRNGDAHLKNFGLLYDDPEGRVELAPVYDLVTTSVYMPGDSMALTMGGSTRWPDAKKLSQFGQIRAGFSKYEIGQIFASIADAMSDVTKEMTVWFSAQNPEFGEKLVAVWAEGLKSSLGVVHGYSSPSP